MGMGLSTKAKSSGSCESDRIEEEKNFSQVSDEDTDDDMDSKKEKALKEGREENVSQCLKRVWHIGKL